MALVLLFMSLISLPSLLHSQQPYEGLAFSDCQTQHNSTSLLGYFCDRTIPTSCQAFLTFQSRPPYVSVPAISNLFSADPSQLSQLNSVADDYVFPTGTEVIVLVRCSCSGSYYQANTSYTVQKADTEFVIANSTFQGLSTCQAIWQQNQKDLISGMEITVPLRCACPSANQSGNGVKYLLSYLVSQGDTVYGISKMLGVQTNSTLDANGLSWAYHTIYPFTTLLVPLNKQPNISQITVSLPPSTSLASPLPGKSAKRMWIYIVVPVFACLVVLVSCVYFIRGKKKNKAGQQEATPVKVSETSNKNSSLPHQGKEQGLPDWLHSKVSGIGQSLRMYTIEEIKSATNNFSHMIEKSVYRGVFNGNIAAVKMVNRDVTKEIDILKKISHFNLIKLQGVCFSEIRWFLVFEHAANGSLSNWIFDHRGSTQVLSWDQRVQIALDVATGLDYLHSYTEPTYVHKDIRSSNILLDGNLRGKIANFGMATSAQVREGEFVMTRHIVGTQGYMAPEYLEHGFVSPKLDVYAFGVVMAEIVTGKDAISLQRGEDGLSLEDFATMANEEEVTREKLGRFVDPTLEGYFPLDSALVVARVIQGCLRNDASSRHSMGEIVQSLCKLMDSASGTLLAPHSSRTEKLLLTREASDHTTR